MEERGRACWIEGQKNLQNHARLFTDYGVDAHQIMARNADASEVALDPVAEYLRPKVAIAVAGFVKKMFA